MFLSSPLQWEKKHNSPTSITSPHPVIFSEVMVICSYCTWFSSITKNKTWKQIDRVTPGLSVSTGMTWQLRVRSGDTGLSLTDLTLFMLPDMKTQKSAANTLFVNHTWHQVHADICTRELQSKWERCSDQRILTLVSHQCKWLLTHWLRQGCCMAFHWCWYWMNTTCISQKHRWPSMNCHHAGGGLFPYLLYQPYSFCMSTSTKDLAVFIKYYSSLPQELHRT